jgi:hypothetical protein
MSQHTTDTRDTAVRKLQRVNRWLIAGSILLTGVLTDLAANAFPENAAKMSAHGRAKASTPRAHHHALSRVKTPTGSLKPPAQAPEASAEAPSSSAAAPTGESAPSGESVPTQELAPEPESNRPAETAVESTPSREPAPEPPEPVISGGS